MWTSVLYTTRISTVEVMVSSHEGIKMVFMAGGELGTKETISVITALGHIIFLSNVFMITFYCEIQLQSRSLICLCFYADSHSKLIA